MVSTTMNIPDTIVVGYQERNDTYNGKLAYVIYIDQKGKLRKEASWTSWTREKLGRDDFKNEPMSGFVLNKGVGGQRESYGWNARNEYIRVYDPREFEFEISVANLMFILQECDSIKGKGLQGEFVYAWWGSELVLLPVSSQEYKECRNFTDGLSKKVTKKDMTEGCLYLMKDMTKVMYLGRHDYYEPDTDYVSRSNGGYDYYYLQHHLGKKHLFLDMDSESSSDRIILQPGFTKLSEKLSTEPLAEFAGAYDRFKESRNSSPLTGFVLGKHEIDMPAADANYWNLHALMPEGDQYVVVGISRVNYTSNGNEEGTFCVKMSNPFLPELGEKGLFVPRAYSNRNMGYRHTFRSHYLDTSVNITRDQLANLDLYDIYFTFENGHKHKVSI